MTRPASQTISSSRVGGGGEIHHILRNSRWVGTTCVAILVVCCSATIALAQSPSFSNRRPSGAESKSAHVDAVPVKSTTEKAKEKCDVEPSKVQIGGHADAGGVKVPDQTGPYKPVSPTAHWRCDRPIVRAGAVWAGEAVVCNFEFANEGAKPLSIRARGG